MRLDSPASTELAEVRRQLLQADRPLGTLAGESFTFSAHVAGRNLWILATGPGQPFALRAVYVSNGDLTVHHVDAEPEALHIEAISDAGAFRVNLNVENAGKATRLHCATRLIPSHDLRLSYQPRDVVVLEGQGTSPQTSGRLYTHQHGYQTGSFFAVCAGNPGSAIYYFQNFSALHQYFQDTHTNPKDAVGGSWPEVGFRLPTSEDNPLLASNDYTISDCHIVLHAQAPISEGEAALCYLDSLAEVAKAVEPPPRSYHNWPQRAKSTVYDLSHSPECTYEVSGSRYLAPYVASKNKPPESMVQLTALVALAEFETWSGETFDLTRTLLDGVRDFVDHESGTIVRWLPGAAFRDREDEHQTHEAMDSWYLYHVLFNLSRLAEAGHAASRRIFEQSLPFAVRVAKRFAYRWPIFFNIRTLDVIQAEGEKGSGGENDVSGLYALVMLRAHQIFGGKEYLEEARHAAAAMEGFGFGLVYQTNTTGFAAEAALRLWKLTGERRYFDLMLVALANIYDNMSLWEPSYGNARYYSTYFGLYPLRGAPYIAAYEEIEALAKFHEFLRLGGDDIPASVILLMSEFAKWLVSRGWHYYPDQLPQEMLSAKPRNGAIRRELSVPLEDLQDGLVPSGQVGQEIYGSGLALVCATRHFKKLARKPFMLFCEYPLEDLGKNRFRVIGDPAMRCIVRLVPDGPNSLVSETEIAIARKTRSHASRSVEGHVMLEVRGDDIVTIRPRRKR